MEAMTEREIEGLRRENSGLNSQRMAAICAREVVGGWHIVRDNGVPVRMEWHWTASTT